MTILHARAEAFDTYLRNADRHAPTGGQNLDNVFLSRNRLGR